MPSTSSPSPPPSRLPVPLPSLPPTGRPGRLPPRADAVAWAASPSWEREAGEHREILRLALAGDADGAARALHAHIASFVHRAFPETAGTDRSPEQEGRE